MEMKYANRMEDVKPSAIREIAKLISQKPGIISFAGGWPAPELFPVDKMKEVCDKVIAEDGNAALQYSSTEGYLPLRELIAQRMKASDIKTEPANILVTNGSQQGLDFSGKLFLNEGDVIICESPTYVGAISAFNAYRPRYVEVSMDEEGMITEELAQALEQNPQAKFIYTIPDFQNPTGRTMSLSRRKRLVELATQYKVPVIEDNPYVELRFEGERLPAVKHFDENGMVIYLGTFSKIFCPGLRVGWVVGDPAIVRKYVLLKQGADLQANTMSQREVYKFSEMFDFDEHVATLVREYSKRRELMLQTMKQEFPASVKFTYPKGGLFTWVELPQQANAGDVLKKALAEGVAFVPGDAFYPNGGKEKYFRLNYASSTEKQIVEGITKLGKVLKSL